MDELSKRMGPGYKALGTDGPNGSQEGVMFIFGKNTQKTPKKTPKKNTQEKNKNT